MDMRTEVHDGSEGDGQIRGRASMAAFTRRAVETVQTVHHGHTPEIELTSANSARGVWAMEDKLRWPEGSPLRSLHGYGHYHETYEHIDRRWYIKTTTRARLWVDLVYTNEVKA